MFNDLSKTCSDFLRISYTQSSDNKLKASHAHELVAAFFGYKSHAALISEKKYPLANLENADVLIPDINLMESRRKQLKDLFEHLPNSLNLAENIAEYLKTNQLFKGDIWLTETLDDFIIEEVLIKEESFIENELAGVMAETNAFFDEMYIDDATVISGDDEILIKATGTFSGTNHEDKGFCGDTIDMIIDVTLYRIAGKASFSNPEISVGGAVNDDWVDPELKYGKPLTMRPKEQFIEKTGGFIVGESKEKFLEQQQQIQSIEKKIREGKVRVDDINALSKLRNPFANDEFGEL